MSFDVKLMCLETLVCDYNYSECKTDLMILKKVNFIKPARIIFVFVDAYIERFTYTYVLVSAGREFIFFPVF